MSVWVEPVFAAERVRGWVVRGRGVPENMHSKLEEAEAFAMRMLARGTS